MDLNPKFSYTVGMITRTYLKISAACLLVGLIFCAYQQEWIIIRRPSMRNASSATSVAIKKTAKLTYWDKGAWHSESLSLVWPAQTARALEYLINSWLSLLDEESSAHKRVSVQSVMINPSGQEAYVSFDHSPFDTQQTVHEKWMWVEGLLTTIRENISTIQSVRLFVRHKQLNDLHLDFTNAWPVRGFLTT